MKILGHKSYGSIPHLSNSKLGPGEYHIHEGQERILTEKVRDKHDKVYVFEKYDGSNVAVLKQNGIHAIVRAGYEATTSPYKMHHVFADWVARHKSIFTTLLAEGERLCGEWLYQAHGLTYLIPAHVSPIVFFDLFTPDNERVSQEELFARVRYYDLELPRLIHCGKSATVASLLDTLNFKTSRIKAVDNPEGMIYRVERNGKVDFLAKWVRSDFKTGQYLDKEIYNYHFF